MALGHLGTCDCRGFHRSLAISAVWSRTSLLNTIIFRRQIRQASFTASILLAFKQICQQARTIYYHENRFYVLINDYDVTNYTKWTQKIEALRKRHEVLKTVQFHGYSMAGAPHWRNLLYWFQKYHEGVIHCSRCPPSRMSPRSNEDEVAMALAGLFLVVKAMRNHPWEEIEALLLEHRIILANVDSRWNKEE